MGSAQHTLYAQCAVFKINVKYDLNSNALVLDIIQHNFCGDNMQDIEYSFILIRMPPPIC